MEVKEETIRKSTRRVAPIPVPHRIQNLFHHEKDHEPIIHRKLQRIHTNPSVYMINDFLSETDLEYFDKNITQHGDHFLASFIEDEQGEKQIVEERTSTYIFMDKGRDATIRSIESRAADLVSLGPDYVEPLQIVSYTKGQKFELHHDAGTMMEDGTVEINPPKRLVTLFVYLNNLPEGILVSALDAFEVEKASDVIACRVLQTWRPVDKSVKKTLSNPLLTPMKRKEFRRVIQDAIVENSPGSLNRQKRDAITTKFSTLKIQKFSSLAQLSTELKKPLQ